jgi:hypothetical protein
MSNCSMCGIGIPDGQGVCSMCYGDPYFGVDGYYLAEMEREMKNMEDMERDIDEENIPLKDMDNDLPF